MRGQYKTVQRKAIIDCLSHARGHMTAAAVHAALSESGHTVSSATVYRPLEKLIDEGVAMKSTPVGEKSACFEIIDRDACEAPHCYHMKCLFCGRLIHLDCDEVERLCAHMLDKHGFRIDMTSTVLFGTCKECSAQSADLERRNA